MKTAKLTLGIVSIVLSLVILFQSCAAGLGSALENNKKDTSGSAGVFTGLFFIVAGIIGIAARKSKGGAIAAAIIYGLAGIIGIAATGIFKDLLVWGVISFIFAAVYIISTFTQKYGKAPEEKWPCYILLFQPRIAQSGGFFLPFTWYTVEKWETTSIQVGRR
ncbi:MAG: hypothetical protein ABF449_11515 [Ethanoligenens sp.]|uniref:hypothetical protein n=1 Tax=Ethanoligenens sp. TaxID=2099655 RepID=UPI0039E79AE3